MQEINVDFHIHSRYAKGVSPEMNVPRIAEGARGKGLDVIATGDATHPGWLKHLEDSLKEESGGLYSVKGDTGPAAKPGEAGFLPKTHFIITAEVEDRDRVHHLLLFPSLECAERFRNDIKSSSADIDTDGRPHVAMSGAELVDLANDCDALIGPCHAFTPWTSVYKAFDSLKDCYGDNLRYVKFVELGLSADSDMADRVAELKDLTFMSNSDAHSPYPHRVGREFNRLSVEGPTFDDIKKAIERKAGRKFTLNVGLNPREGKYHETACTRCFLKFRVDDAMSLKRRCPECRGIIKTGVKERIEELSKGGATSRPKHRPPYMYTVPLAEVIGMSRGVATLTSPRVQAEWAKMVEKFGPEIGILIDMDVRQLKAYDAKIGGIIEAFRKGKILYDSGGGGNYGKPLYDKPLKENFYDSSQKSLGQF